MKTRGVNTASCEGAERPSKSASLEVGRFDMIAERERRQKDALIFSSRILSLKRARQGEPECFLSSASTTFKTKVAEFLTLLVLLLSISGTLITQVTFTRLFDL